MEKDWIILLVTPGQRSVAFGPYTLDEATEITASDRITLAPIQYTIITHLRTLGD